MNRAKLLVMIAILAGLPLAGQEKPKPQGPMATRVFQLKYADPHEVYMLLRGLANVGYSVVDSPALRAIAVTAPPDVVTGVEDALRRIDVPSAAKPAPSPDVDVTAYLLIASTQESAGGAIPAALAPVVQELRNALDYRGFRLLDSVLLRARQGENASANGVVGGEGSLSTTYQFNIRPDQIEGAPDARVVRFGSLRLSVHVPVQNQYQETGINTSISAREGQKVVVGKSSMGDNKALILVLTARVVE